MFFIETIFSVKVFEMEKRLREVDTRCQSMVDEAKEMKKELEINKQQTQQLLRILAGKKILDPGN
jgi:hypothetical protein